MSAEQVTDGYLRLWREFYADKDFSGQVPGRADHSVLTFEASRGQVAGQGG